MRRVVLALALLLPMVAHAVPLQLNHQGRLVDSAGVGVSGSHALTFKLYTTGAGGAPLWSETITMDLADGYFAATLGLDSLGNPIPDSVIDQPQLWLGVALDAGAEFPQRFVMNSVPYAFRAAKAEGVDGGIVDASEIRVDGTTVIDANGMFVGDLSQKTLSDLTCTANQVPIWTGSAWGCASAAQSGGVVTWEDVRDIPAGFRDGVDNDTLAAKVCTADQILYWNDEFAIWGCRADRVSTTTEIRAAVTGSAIPLAAGSTVGGTAISTLTASEARAAVSGTSIGLASGSTVGGAPISTFTAADARAAVSSPSIGLASGSTVGGVAISTLTAAEARAAVSGTSIGLASGSTVGGVAISTVTIAQAVSAVQGAPIALAAGSTVGGAPISTLTAAAAVDAVETTAQLDLHPSATIGGLPISTLQDDDVVDLVEAGGLSLSGPLTADAASFLAGVKLGTDASCTPAKAGTLRFTGTSLDICSGTWRPVWTGGGVGTTQADARTSCKAIRDTGTAGGSGFYWIDPNGGATTDAFKVWCDMTLQQGGWTLVMTVNPSDGNSVRFSNNVFWVNDAEYGRIENALVTDYKSPASYLSTATEILVAVYHPGPGGDAFGWKHWTMPIKTFDAFFDAPNNTVQTTSVVASDVAGVYAYEPVIKRGTQLMSQWYADPTADRVRFTSDAGRLADDNQPGIGTYMNTGSSGLDSHRTADVELFVNSGSNVWCTTPVEGTYKWIGTDQSCGQHCDACVEEASPGFYRYWIYRIYVR